MKPLVKNTILNTPLKKKSVVMLVIDRIKQALINGELKPGDFIPSESELTQNLGVGKSSVREATKMLQAMGVLEVKRGQGTVIRKNPDEDALNPMVFQLILAKGIPQDLIDLRKMFEPAYSIMAMEKATDEDILTIEKTLLSFEDVIRNGIQDSSHDLAFHMAVLFATHNRMVIRIGKTLMELFDASIETSMKVLPDVALKDHKAIFKALRERDGIALRKAIVTSSISWETSLTYK